MSNIIISLSKTYGQPLLFDATNWGQSGLNYTNAIASYPLSRSPYGVEDMAGNVSDLD